MNLFKPLLIVIMLVSLDERASSQTPLVKKGIYYLIDTLSNKNKKLYTIHNYDTSRTIFGSYIKFDYPCYYNGEYSPEFFQFKKTVKTIGKKEVKRLPLMSGHDFLELICKYGVRGGVLFTDYDIYFIERLKKRKYLLYKVMSSAPPRIE